MDLKRKKFNKKVLNKLFQAVGFKKFNEKFCQKSSVWYQKRTWTKAQESEFRTWYVKNYVKDLKVTEEEAGHDFEWFSLAYGWKLKD